MSAPQPIPQDDDGVHALPPLPPVAAAEAAAQLDRQPADADEPAAEGAAPPSKPPRPRRPPAKRPAQPRKPKSTVPPRPKIAPELAAARFEAAAVDSGQVPPDAGIDADAATVGSEPVAAAPEPEPVVSAKQVVEPELEPEPEVVEPEPEIVEPEPVNVGSEVAQTEPEPDVIDAEHESDLALLMVDDADDERESRPAEAIGESDISSSPPAVRLRAVTKTFGSTVAVDAIDLRIEAGTFYGIVGPNGAGKTTTLSMIAGLLRPDRGDIEIAGVDLAADPRRAKQQMGILPDRLRTFDRLTGRQLLHYYGVLRGLRSSVVESRSAELARAFDLTDALSRPVSDYSAGMTKKIMLAGAMIHSPRVLVLDEPFESVDPVSSAVVLDILSAYVSHGGTVVLSSHGMELVERVCSGLAVIVGGRVLAEGTVDEVRGGLTLEERFIQLSGGISDAEGLEWLHTFSD
ncbi:ABC transporter ATP-binding protein [Microbacterium sp. VKM Ac-2870]|uniref:ABC transporter ATP-binding protein n=1 Tax=Microbacterium sp. VKM Ac-2870 TaxID=2783825 RepID=UPI00188AB551|nr:ABC transporter ATP-binding protein [Microbacterium sp. VKM Ac-2870]MBF4560599.1 ABC transporter ATP-binding protein [Microbacterium sp. VKM Ac-2870]